MGMMQHFFADGDMSMFPMMVPVFMVMMFIVMMIFRSLFFRQSRFGPMGRYYHRRRGRFRRAMFFDKEEESSSARSEARIQPVKSQREKPKGSPMQVYLDKAHVYQEQINTLIDTAADPKTYGRFQGLTAQVDEWVRAIENLVKRIDRFAQNGLVQQDLESVPQAVAKLEERLAGETNESTRIELERTLAGRKKQLAALEQLQTTIRRAEINIESTLSALGTLYSQVLTAQSTNQVADYSRLSVEADEEVRTLQDHLEALAEVKLGAAALSGA